MLGVAKASEDDSDSPMEVHSAIDSTASASILNETSSKVNKRRRGGLETSVSQDSSLSVTIEQPKTKSRSTKKNTKTPRNTKQATTSKSQASPSKGESSTSRAEKRVSYNLMSDNEDHSEAPSKKKAKSSKKGGKEQKQSPERGSSKNISFDKNVTPKTSPVLNVSFTPHRSKKTPRKSPMNLGSPKTHSPSPVKFTLVPRKLEIVDSPPSSENSLLQNNSLNAGNDSIHNTSKSRKSSKSKLNVSSSKKIAPFKPRPTFSKSPKIVLKTPKAKSSKKGTSNTSAGSAKSKKTSPLKQKKSPMKSAKPAKSVKQAKNESLSVSANTSGLIDFNETVTPQKSLDSTVNTSVKSPVKSPKAASLSKSKLELLSSSLKSIPKVVLSSVSTKTPSKSSKPASPTKSKGSPKKGSPVKSVASPKSKLTLVPKGSPKVVLVRKSPVKSVKKTSPTKPKVSSPSKAKKSSPKAKGHVINTSQESSKAVASPLKTEVKSTSKSTSASGSPKKSNKTPTKSSRSSLNTSSRKTPTKSSRSSLNTSSRKTPNTSLSTTSSPKKMPKIVLTLKSKKSPLKSTKSATLLSAKKSPKASASKIQKVLVKSPRSTPVSKALKVPIKRLSRKSSPTKNTSKNATLSPKVVVSKLSSPELRNNNLRAKENQPSVALVPVDHEAHKSTASTSKSPTKSPKLAATRKSKSPVKSPKSVVKKPVTGRTSLKPNTPSSAVTNRLLKLKPTSTSTPREKGKPTRSPLGKSKIIKRLNNQSTLQITQPLLADESEPFLDNSSLIRMSDVFDVDSPRKNTTFDKNSSKTKSPKAAEKLNKSDTFEVEKSPKNSSRRSNRSGTFEVTKTSPNTSGKNKSKKNNTYEVNEPKTPGLQSKSMKRTVNQAELDGEPSTKKSRKVNFASPARETTRASSINRIGTPAHPKNPRKTPVSIRVTKTPIEARSRINSVGLGNKTPLCTPSNKRRSISVGDPTRRSNYDAQLASVNRLSRPKAVIDSHKKLGNSICL